MSRIGSVRRRGIAVAIVASGNYLAGAIWPPILQHAIATIGWRQTHLGIGVLCLVTMLPLTFLLRRRIQLDTASSAADRPSAPSRLPASPAVLQGLLVLAGVSCCVAMSMPQVHMVAYCGDLGYGPARGAEMLSIMLGMGVVSRLASGFIADRIGGAGTLILGSTLQCLALFFYLPFDGLTSLYIVSAVFGLSQGGIVPSYALIVREYFPAQRGRHPGQPRADGDCPWHGLGWLDVGRDLRSHRLLPCRLPQRHRLEPAQHDDRAVAADEPLAADAEPAARSVTTGRQLL